MRTQNNKLFIPVTGNFAAVLLLICKINVSATELLSRSSESASNRFLYLAFITARAEKVSCLSTWLKTIKAIRLAHD